MELKVDQIEVRGCCPHDCPDTCAWTATVENGVVTHIKGRKEHPITAGHLCLKVQHYEDRVYHPDRILTPLVRRGAKGSSSFTPVSWAQALDVVRDGITRAIDGHGSTGVLPYSYLGTQGVLQSSSMDGRFFNALGASDLERGICYAAGGWGWGLTYPSGWPATDIEDVPNAKLVVAWGVNMVSTHLHLWPFLLAARKRGATIVCVDPLRSKTASASDWHIQLRPGSDGALALGMMNVIFGEGLDDRSFLEERCVGGDELRARAAEWPVARATAATGLAAQDIERFARAYAMARPSFIKMGPGAQRHADGGQAFRAVLALPAVTGAWRDRGGGAHVHSAGVFPDAGNAMDRPDLRPPGTKRSVNMVRLGEALEPQSGIGAIVIYNSNPAVICPDTNRVLRGLARDDLFTVSLETTMTETAAYADVVLPATTQLEHLDVFWSWGHRYVTLNRPAIAPRGESAANTEIFRRLADALGLDAEPLRDSDENLLNTYLAIYPDDVRTALFDNGFAKVTPTIAESDKALLRSDAMTNFGLDPLPSARDEPIPGVGLIVLSPKSHYFLNSTFVNHDRMRKAAGSPVIAIAKADALDAGLADGELARLRNDSGEVEGATVIDDAVLAGTVVLLGNWWNRDLPGGRGANALTNGDLTDLGGAGVLTVRARLERAG